MNMFCLCTSWNKTKINSPRKAKYIDSAQFCTLSSTIIKPNTPLKHSKVWFKIKIKFYQTTHAFIFTFQGLWQYLNETHSLISPQPFRGFSYQTNIFCFWSSINLPLGLSSELQEKSRSIGLALWWFLLYTRTNRQTIHEDDENVDGNLLVTKIESLNWKQVK